jgi:hypothetical protein
MFHTTVYSNLLFLGKVINPIKCFIFIVTVENNLHQKHIAKRGNKFSPLLRSEKSKKVKKKLVYFLSARSLLR